MTMADDRTQDLSLFPDRY